MAIDSNMTHERQGVRVADAARFARPETCDVEQVATVSAVPVSDGIFRAVANAVPQMMWSASADGQHNCFNTLWYDFTGVPDGSTNGDQWSSVFHPDDQSDARLAWHNTVTTGAVFEVQHRIRHRSGSYRWTLGRALPVYNECGKITCWVGTHTDIHAQKIIEEQLRQLVQRKDEFLVTLAHEMRNPLAPISAAAELLLRFQYREPRIQHAAEIIQRQALHLNSLVNDLLDVFRVARRSVKLENLPLDLNVVATSAIEQAAPLIRVRNQHLTFRQSREPAMVSGDQRRLVEVAANLLNNAAKYTDKGGNITINVEVEAGQVCLSVLDNGIGMTPELVSHVFDLFAQAKPTPEHTSGGLGLGLPLVKSLVEQHGGTVSCVSGGLGKGSAFFVRLPKMAAAIAG